MLTLCYLAQLLIGTSQPFGLSALPLIGVGAAGTAVQFFLFVLLKKRPGKDSFPVRILMTASFPMMIGYDLVKGDRFCQSVSAEHMTFIWLMVCMLLIGFYAAHCGRHALERASQICSALVLISLAALALHGRYQIENLEFFQKGSVSQWQTARVFLEFAFSGELLLWMQMSDRGKASNTEKDRTDPILLPWRPLCIRFGVLAVFALLGEAVFGRRFPAEAQLFGRLSVLCGLHSGVRPGALYQSIWLMALSLRIGAACCALHEVWDRYFGSWKLLTRILLACFGILLSAAVWMIFWRQDCLLFLSGCTAAAIVLSVFMHGKKGEAAA